MEINNPSIPGNNTVGTAQIITGAVTAEKLAIGALPGLPPVAIYAMLTAPLGQSVNNDTNTQVTSLSVVFNSGFTVSTANELIVPAGNWQGLVGGWVDWDAAAAMTIRTTLVKNGLIFTGSSAGGAAGAAEHPAQSITTFGRFVGGDVLSLYTIQDSGAAQTIYGAAMWGLLFQY